MISSKKMDISHLVESRHEFEWKNSLKRKLYLSNSLNAFSSPNEKKRSKVYSTVEIGRFHMSLNSTQKLNNVVKNDKLYIIQTTWKAAA